MEKSKNYLYIVIVVVGLLLLAGAMYYYSNKTQNIPPNTASGSLGNVLGNQEKTTNDQKTMTPVQQVHRTVATISTSEGDIQIELYEKDAPKTVKNFADLARKGFYDNLIFHRVIKDFMIQGGDPNCGSVLRETSVQAGSPQVQGRGDGGQCGAGGPGYEFADELNPATQSYKDGYIKGVMAMANHGPNTNGSQFFIMLADRPLQHNYTIFGKVISGQEVVDKIGLTKTNASDKPLTDAVIRSVKIEEK